MNDPIERYRELLKQYPENELARFSLGKAYFDRGDFASARGEFAAALERKPDWMVVQILLGKCEHSLGNVQAARGAWQRGLALAIEQHHEGPQAEVEELLANLAGG